MKAQAVRNHSFGSLKLSASNAAAAALAHPVTHFFMLFAISIGLTVFLFSMAGLEFQQGLVLAIAALTTTGPLVEVALVDPISYALLDTPVKAILGLAMIVGRLETLALIALFAPDGWRR